VKVLPQRWDDELGAWWCRATTGPPPLTIVSRAIKGLFLVNPFSGVTVSTDQAEGIALFAGISPVQYLRACAALGLVQWRALEQNDMLVAEDFAHSEPSNCLFVPRARKCDYALAFEWPCICHGCFEFYHCLGAEREIVSAAQLLHSLRVTTPDNPGVRVLR
jgi:hypothetical protein